MTRGHGEHPLGEDESSHDRSQPNQGQTRGLPSSQPSSSRNDGGTLTRAVDPSATGHSPPQREEPVMPPSAPRHNARCPEAPRWARIWARVLVRSTSREGAREIGIYVLVRAASISARTGSRSRTKKKSVNMATATRGSTTGSSGVGRVLSRRRTAPRRARTTSSSDERSGLPIRVARRRVGRRSTRVAVGSERGRNARANGSRANSLQHVRGVSPSVHASSRECRVERRSYSADRRTGCSFGVCVPLLHYM